MEDKYPLHAQMYARMFLKSRGKHAVNANFLGGDDASVEEAADQLGCTIEQFLSNADAYLEGGRGIVG